ncbi:nuclease EXOG, mitochondrial isoform X3 [Rousettus aegyptiacus]|uniref:nuclease EXOG, mitochondrial isoform X3 n=1 Tax=Rousettus aegyptiacus TaxID=9407 RepID=UPI00168CE423|nr:nuclease EXOG, mitochondrial isoform X3 [Rousettus aegyptiacus]XP_015979492.2 nuclease EXOG, mitochondrial isoform X3 [Rousettus aegyptiacus]
MAAKSFVSRLQGSRQFLRGFVAGAVVGAAGAGLTALQFFRSQGAEAALAVREPEGPAEKSLLEQFGFPLTGTETRCYTNHALSYDQSKRVPRWVLEHISKNKIIGDADRKHCKFKPDPNIPPAFSALNKDYIGSGWSRGHMAPAGNNKFSPKAMAETFYLSNIVPQNFDNNAGYWNRIEMYCRELTERFEDVWIVSGPLTLPQTGRDGKKMVSYQCLLNTCWNDRHRGYNDGLKPLTSRSSLEKRTCSRSHWQIFNSTSLQIPVIWEEYIWKSEVIHVLTLMCAFQEEIDSRQVKHT